MGGPAVHRRLWYMRINVAKLPEVTVVRGHPGIGGGDKQTSAGEREEGTGNKVPKTQ